MVAEGERFTSGYLSEVDAAELAAGQRFGTIVFDFVPSAGGWVSAEHSAFGRFSVEIASACLDE